MMQLGECCCHDEKHVCLSEPHAALRENLKITMQPSTNRPLTSHNESWKVGAASTVSFFLLLSVFI